MCGIAGFINYTNNNNDNTNLSLLNKFCDHLSHRGPDSNGVWYDLEQKIFLAHTRLSINDLTKTGFQPMINKNNEQTVIFNGEIYNHKEIRLNSLKDYNIKWIGNSDTETLLKTIEFFGIEKSLDLFEGMFAFCLYDKKNKKLYLVRDKFGEKPLYYGTINNNFVFGSELKIFSFFPNFKNKISKVGLDSFLKYSYVPEPYSIYENVFKLGAGEYLVLNLKNINFKNPDFNINTKKIKWYNINNYNEINELGQTLTNSLDDILNFSVNESLTSDVEVGSFLSGGIDSSLISAIAQQNSKNKLKTFSICFENEKFNEKEYSRLVADHINSDHKEYIVNNKDMFDYYEQIPSIYDEPFADSSQIPTAILSKFASKDVKVCLTGDGADELFGGYNRYIFIKKINTYLKFLPRFAKNNLSNLILKLDYSKLVFLGNLFNKYLFNNKFIQFEDKIHKFGIMIKNSRNELDMYFNLIETFNDIQNPAFNFVNENNFSQKIKRENYFLKDYSNNIEKIMKIDQKTYLTGDILHKVDRASMFYSLETRIPFLNSKVVNFSDKLPFNYKINNFYGKFILREIAKKYLPNEIIKRKKMGFSVPLNSWITENTDEFKKKFEKKKEYLEYLGFNYNSILNHFEQNRQKKKKLE